MTGDKLVANLARLTGMSATIREMVENQKAVTADTADTDTVVMLEIPIPGFSREVVLGILQCITAYYDNAGAGAGAGAASGERVGNVDPRLKFPDGGAAASAGAASGADAGAERHGRSRPSTPSLTWGKNEVATFDKTEAPRGGILKSTKSSYSRGSGGGAIGSAKGGRGGSSGGSIGVDSRQRGGSDSDEIARLKAELAAKAREVEAEKQKVARVQQSAQRYAAAVRISV